MSMFCFVFGIEKRVLLEKNTFRGEKNSIDMYVGKKLW